MVKNKTDYWVNNIADGYGVPFNIITVPIERELLEGTLPDNGWETCLQHRCYGQGNVLIIGICVTRKQAMKMHFQLRKQFLRTPPDCIEAITVPDNYTFGCTREIVRTFIPRDTGGE